MILKWGVYLAYKVGRCLLRYHLEEIGMSQQELANRLNVTRQQINKYINNRQKMSLQIAKSVSDILDCQIEDLYEWIEVGENE